MEQQLFTAKRRGSHRDKSSHGYNASMFRRVTPELALKGLTEIEKKYAPEYLYVAGNHALLRVNPRISIVGSRKPGAANRELAFELGKWIAENGGVVVSGLAAGIDTAAHSGALAATGGQTIAVLGTPLSEYYPKQNRELQNRLMAEQLVVSQFEKSTGPKGFVMRNRTMALISHATIIIEAGEKSGTRHQAWEALRLNRQLFLPSSLLDAPFSWPRDTVEYGAVGYDDPGQLMMYLQMAFDLGVKDHPLDHISDDELARAE